MKRFIEPILVTRPYLPDLEEYKEGLAEIWKNQWLTNNGPMVRKFQAELSRYLQVPETNMALFVNGTLALELGYKAMELFGGEVITTPFTFVATSHALRRVGARPVFADIDPETLCLDPAKVEPLIKPGITKAIVPVHVYGNVCDIEGFNRLSEKYGIPIIYDAAHAFGVTMGQVEKVGGISTDRRELCEAKSLEWCGQRCDSTSIGVAGDMSMFSFHPTKLFHSCEGGLLVFKNTEVQNRLFELRNFAIHSELECTDVGSNAKMNELQALMGLCCLRKIDELLDYRQKIYQMYASIFEVEKVGGISTDRRSLCEAKSLEWCGQRKIQLLPCSANKAYVPVLFKDYETRERVYTELKEKCNVFSRRYFYPLLTDFAPYEYAKGTCPVAEDIAKRVLTLPTYYGLDLDDVKHIAENVLEMV